MSGVSIFFNHLYTAFSILLPSGFDTGSDLINSLDFLGYNASKEVGEAGCAVLNQSFRIQWGCDAMDNASSKEHTLWGIVGISLMVLPGIIGVQIKIWPYISEGKYRKALLLSLVALAYPVILILMAFASIFIGGIRVFGGNDELMKWTIRLVAAEAFFESFPQMILQGYTILYGYEVTTVQIFSICASFGLLAKTCIEIDLFMLDTENPMMNDPFKSMIHTIKSLPTHGVTIIFRVLSFSLTIAFLRVWSVIPIAVLYFGLVIITYKRYRHVDDKWNFLAAMWCVPLSNLSALNVYNIADQRIFIADRPSRDRIFSFIRASSIWSFVLHAIVLIFIMVLANFSPEYLNQRRVNGRWSLQDLLLKHYDVYFYVIFVGTIALGLVSVILVLRKIKRLAIDTD